MFCIGAISEHQKVSVKTVFLVAYMMKSMQIYLI